MSPQVTASLAACATGLVWLGVLTGLRPGKDTPAGFVVLALLAGAAAFRLLHSSLIEEVNPLTLTGWVMHIGLREETAKLLAVLPVLLLAKHGRVSPALLGSLAGLGFAVMENRVLFAQHEEPTLLPVRLITATPLHLALTGITAAALHTCLSSPGGRAFFQALLLLGSAAAVHGLYDWAPPAGPASLQIGGSSLLSLLAVFAAWLMLTRQLPAQGRARWPWLLGGWIFLALAAIGLTWLHWQTGAALLACAREIVLFTPLLAGFITGLLGIKSRQQDKGKPP